jgi:hypothetical protein
MELIAQRLKEEISDMIIEVSNFLTKKKLKIDETEVQYMFDMYAVALGLISHEKLSLESIEDSVIELLPLYVHFYNSRNSKVADDVWRVVRFNIELWKDKALENELYESIINFTNFIDCVDHTLDFFKESLMNHNSI